MVDASVLAAALVDAGSEGRWAESIIDGSSLVAPELALVETTSVLRRLENIKDISPLEATSAHRDLLHLDLELFPFYPFAGRVWGLRHNLTSYDAWYVAIAEALRCPLATLDLKFSRAAGAECNFVTPSD